MGLDGLHLHQNNFFGAFGANISKILGVNIAILAEGVNDTPGEKISAGEGIYRVRTALKKKVPGSFIGLFTSRMRPGTQKMGPGGLHLH